MEKPIVHDLCVPRFEAGRKIIFRGKAALAFTNKAGAKLGESLLAWTSPKEHPKKHKHKMQKLSLHRKQITSEGEEEFCFFVEDRQTIA